MALSCWTGNTLTSTTESASVTVIFDLPPQISLTGPANQTVPHFSSIPHS